MEDMVHRNYTAGRLKFTTDLKECLDEVEVVFSAVGTPPDEDGSADLKYVLEVARTIGRNMNKYVLPYDSIYYLESALRKINVYGDVAHQPLCSYYGKLNELPQALFENGFLRVGRSAVVNMKYIRQISSYMVTLRNGVKLGVSRNGYAEIRSTYLEWKGQFGDD